MAATLLMAVNLLRYVTAVPPPVAEPDSVRYKVSDSPLKFSTSSQGIIIIVLISLSFSIQLCYNENSKKMEFQRREFC